MPAAPLRILIVEDEFLTLEALSGALTGMGYGIAGDAMSAEEALAVLDEGQTDLAILDIHISGRRSGIWLAEQIRERYDIPFIFLTAFSDKATISDAARTRPESYLVKPFVREDLFAAIELAVHAYAERTRLALPDPATDPSTAPASAPEKTGNGKEKLLLTDSIFIKDELMYRRVSVADIQYIQSFRNYLELDFGNNKKRLVRSTLTDFVARLPEEIFLKTHRSYAVNLERVSAIGGNFVIIGNREIPISKEVRQEMMQRLNTY